MSEVSPARASGVTREGWAAYALALTVIVLDQLSKYWILEVYHLPDRGTVPILPVFHLSMVWNRGVSFGLFRAEQDLARWGLAAFGEAGAKRVIEILQAELVHTAAAAGCAKLADINATKVRTHFV